jgi:L-galactose dehydrogenase
MGLLTPQGPPAWHPAPPALKAAAAEAVAAATSLGVDMPGLALRDAVTASPGIATHLVGLCTPGQVRAAVRAAGAALAGPAAGVEAEAMERVRGILGPVEGVTWPSGRPENS